LVAGVGACVVLAAAIDARAANPNCSSLPGTLIYGAGGSSQQPIIGTLATQLAALASPVTIIYSDSGSACAGYSDLVTPTPATGTALYWTAAGVQSSCQLDAGGDPVTFAVMGNAPNLCSGFTGLSAGFGQFLGPVQPIDFVVPSSQTSQESISTEAAYYIWGFGASDAERTVNPWNTPANIFTRSASSFVTLFVGLDTGVPAATVAATHTVEPNNQGTVTALSALNGTAGAASGIGAVSGEVADGNRSAISVLAYQHTGQSCGYWPDSTPESFDKENVRSGQYWLWSPVHLFAAVDQTGNPTDPNTKSLIGYLTGSVTAPAGVNVFAAELAAYTVPQCAMHVWRDGDLAPLYSFQPPASCSCQFDFAENTAHALVPSTCTTCTTDSDCATNHCRSIGTGADAGANAGYCEVN
jgi:hypothetical protein